MRRLIKYLIPIGMMAMVFAAPADSFAAETGADAALWNAGTDTYQTRTVDLQSGRTQITVRELGKLVNKARELCDQAKNGGLSYSDLLQHIIDDTCGGHPGNQPEEPELPEVPEQPEQPEFPEAPEQPEFPDIPEQPEQPDFPDIPWWPDVPDVNVPEEPEVPEQPEEPEQDQNQGGIEAYEGQVVSLVNQERAAQGLSALKINTKLSRVAEAKAEDMRDRGYFSHTSPTYGSPFDMMKQFGISYTSAGENIAKGQKTPAVVMNDWMNSQGHRENILNGKYTEIGVGYVTDSNGGTYWVQMFIRP